MTGGTAEWRRLGTLVHLVTTKADSDEFKIGLEHVEGWTGRLIAGESEFQGEGVAFRSGDVLFGKLRPYLAKVWLADRPGAAVGDFLVLRPFDGMSPRFIAQVLLRPEFIDLVSAAVYGAKMPRVSWDVLRDIPVPAPHLEAQKEVADLIDRETAEIDAFIADQEELIALLEERRDSSWHKLMTALSVDSDPHLGQLVASIVDGPFGSSLTSAHYSDEGTRVIRLGNVGIDEFRDDDKAYIPDTYGAQLAAHEAVCGDVVIAGLGDERMPLGRAAVVPDIGRAIVKADVYRVRPGRKVLAPYLAWVLNAPQTRAEMMLLSRGSTRSRLNTLVVRQVRIPLPTRERQATLLCESRRGASVLKAAIADAREAIALSKERRAALISAAVTGQIDVTERKRVHD